MPEQLQCDRNAQAGAIAASRIRRGDFPVQRLNAWLKQLTSSKPKQPGNARDRKSRKRRILDGANRRLRPELLQ